MSPPRARGRFIVLEGIDGAGTTTQAHALASALTGRGHRVLTTREPSDGPIGTLIRQALTGRLGLPAHSGPLAPDTLALLFAADRVDHLSAQIVPALERGDWVVCDRYLLSSLAYQGAMLPPSWVETINGRAELPDLTLYLDLDVATAAKRRSARGDEPELFDADAAQRKILREYRKVIARRSTLERIVRLDGLLPPADVTRHALREIDTLARR